MTHGSNASTTTTRHSSTTNAHVPYTVDRRPMMFNCLGTVHLSELRLYPYPLRDNGFRLPTTVACTVTSTQVVPCVHQVRVRTAWLDVVGLIRPACTWCGVVVYGHAVVQAHA